VIEILRPPHDGEEMPDVIKSRLSLTENIKAGIAHTDGSEESMKAVAFLERVGQGFSVALAHPRALNPIIDEWLPRLLIITLPFTALLLALFGRKRGLYFVDHVTFALHLQAFLFAIGLIVILVRIFWPEFKLTWPLLVIFSVYSYVAYLRTYPGNWAWAAFKLGIIASVYLCSLLFGIIALLVYGVSTLPMV
jgi:hypothetical protein